MHRGYIKEYRKIVDWEWYTDVNTCHLFRHCLYKANIEDKKWRGQFVARGSFITSLEHLSHETGLSIQQVRTALNKLKSTNDITIKATSQNTVITVNNYDLYQDINMRDNKQITNEQQTNNKQITTTKECKEYKNEKNEKNNIGGEKKNSNPDFYFSSDKNKVFEIYENECKNLIPLTGEKRNRKVLDKTSNFLNEIEFDWDYFKNLCRKANELKTIANTKIDFEMLINCHIGIMNGKYQKDENKRGVSQEFIDNFFENLKKEEAENE